MNRNFFNIRNFLQKKNISIPEKYYKITRGDGTPLFDDPEGIVYKDGAITVLPRKRFKDDPECGNGLQHYRNIDSCVLNSLNLTSKDYYKHNVYLEIIPQIIDFRVFEVMPYREQVRIGYDKYKSRKLKTIEITPKEYIPFFLSSKKLIVRVLGAMKLSQQSEDLKKKFNLPKDESIAMLDRWNYLMDLDQFIGQEVTSTPEYSKFFHGKKIDGTIISIDSNGPVAELENRNYFDLSWLMRKDDLSK
ncbi:MAG: hypothetical protein KAJ54_00415 [Candidatus Aenigmarchaeota archaeon]|nr:hypothetical protein [Candidatus Aenigmarchaeota archaeon]MCK5322190.1 hypothetical protein [Candidatus Aenigmarchaeota archaeon]